MERIIYHIDDKNMKIPNNFKDIKWLHGNVITNKKRSLTNYALSFSKNGQFYYSLTKEKFDEIKNTARHVYLKGTFEQNLQNNCKDLTFTSRTIYDSDKEMKDRASKRKKDNLKHAIDYLNKIKEFDLIQIKLIKLQSLLDDINLEINHQKGYLNNLLKQLENL